MRPHGREDCKGEAQKGEQYAKNANHVAKMGHDKAKGATLGPLGRQNPTRRARFLQNVPEKQTTGGPWKPLGRLELALEVLATRTRIRKPRQLV